ncbi:hypothetical protein BDV41DRAFT_336564 [Aspergillus transmontanensis]|uniref:Uncharacterized protein n=1 Tax=Aspergillus transmontanensis TaxID=1034304 RepID=A0A5N6VTA6_9EURO|nr:hypothetical protein BDV41DRAFT_336564 [Aspergillus transmontanensis]
MEYLNPSSALQYLLFLYISYLGFAALSTCPYVIIPFATSPLHVYSQHVSAACGDMIKNNALLRPLYLDLWGYGAWKNSFGISVLETKAFIHVHTLFKIYLYMKFMRFSHYTGNPSI